MKTLLRNAREAKGLKTREVSQLLKIDAALISKFETGQRMPAREQVPLLANLLEIDIELLHVAWLKQRILHEVTGDHYAIQALKAAMAHLGEAEPEQEEVIPASIQKLMNEMDSLKSMLAAGKKL